MFVRCELLLLLLFGIVSRDLLCEGVNVVVIVICYVVVWLLLLFVFAMFIVMC